MLLPPMDHLSVEDKQLVHDLATELAQLHLFEHCKTKKDIDHLMSQLREANQVLAPGGLRDYIYRGRRLLEESKRGFNPFEHCKVSVPEGVSLDPASADYIRLESIGEQQVFGLCFVLVAGGLGERLGYPGIKISLPVETQSEPPCLVYMSLFAQHILEFQRMAREYTGNNELELPLAIMTSADTHEKTSELLIQNNYFGLDERQVTLMMQGKVPCFINSEGKLSISSTTNDLEMKPHGHGDVHGLLLQTGLAQKWAKEGRKWIFFFQDTNSLSMRSLCACLGVSIERNLAMNSLAVPRAPGEASGGICRLEYIDGRDITASVEYNMLGPLLASQGGDVAGMSGGHSPFPGNCNILLFELERYVEAVEKSRGVVPEFVNPKYADASKTSLKSPTRLECLMQDFALLLESSAVGFCSMPRYVTFSVVKNSAIEALKKQKDKQPMDCAMSGEFEYFDSNCKFLSIAAKHAGYSFEGCGDKAVMEFNGLKHECGPRITLLPSFGATIRAMAEKFNGPIRVVGGPRSSLVIGGHETIIGNLSVDGAFVIDNSRACNIDVKNEGWKLVSVDPENIKNEPAISIRGFVVDKSPCK